MGKNLKIKTKNMNRAEKRQQIRFYKDQITKENLIINLLNQNHSVESVYSIMKSYNKYIETDINIIKTLKIKKDNV
jgi:hypothetical protein